MQNHNQAIVYFINASNPICCYQSIFVYYYPYTKSSVSQYILMHKFAYLRDFHSK